MGRLLRDNYWLPFCRAEALVSGAAPQRVRLLGQDFVAFRTRDGRIGLVDERCPHRLASLALARVEDSGLRCIYHGWLTDVTGAVAEVPSEGERSSAFAARVKTNRYPVREGGGLVWVYLGERETPAFPDLPFVRVPQESRWFCRSVVNCNWLQGFEGALDSVHLGWLHQGWQKADQGHKTLQKSPSYDIEKTDYGLRTAAIRPVDESTVHFRVAEFIAPFYTFSASRQPVIPSDCSVFIAVPVDDETHLLFFGFWDEAGPLSDISGFFSADLDLDNLAITGGDLNTAWGQDREAMAEGHFSGYTDSVLHEDVAVQMSMGPIVDRSGEHLCGTDLAIVTMRRFLLDLVERFDAGEPVDGGLSAYSAKQSLPFSCTASAGSDWRESGLEMVLK